MKKYSIISSFLFSFLFIIPCEAQNKSSKIIKNHFITQYPDEFFFVQCGLQDKAGNMWFGSAGDGIYYYDQTARVFTNFTRNDGLCHNDILCCTKDNDGNIWFGTRNGLIRYAPPARSADGSDRQPNKKDFSNFLISQNIIGHATRKKIPYNYKPADNFVWSIMQDKSGKIWVGTNNGVYVHNPSTDYDGNTPLFTNFLDQDSIVNKDKLQLKNIQSMVEDNEGTLWFVSPWTEGGGEGICRYDPVAERVGGKSIINFKPDGLTSFRSIIKGKNGHLFFLNSFEGVYEFDPSTERAGGKAFTNFSEKIGMKKDTVIAILEDKAGNFWFACASDHLKNGGIGGAWRYDPSAKRSGSESIKLFTIKDGLSHNCVFCVVEDKDNNIWFGTRLTGLCRFNPSAEQKGEKLFTDFTER